MRVRATDNNNDMVFGAGDSGWYVDSPQAVGQLVRDALQLWRGEWFLDTQLGVPMFEDIFRRGVTEQGIADVLRIEIAKVPGVVSVESIDVVVNNRVVSANVVVTSVYGKTKVTV